MIRISVIIPVLNEEKVLGKCLAALAGQSLDSSNFEVVVVDNGSTDRTVEVANSFAGMLQIRVFEERGAYIARLRNVGADYAISPYFAFIDADCVAPPEWLERGVTRLCDFPETVTGAHYAIPEGSSWLAKSWYGGFSESKQGAVSYVPGGDLLVSRSAFRRIGGFDETIETSEDWDFCCRARNLGVEVSADAALSVVHLGTPQTLSGFYTKQNWHGTSVLKSARKTSNHWKNARALGLALYMLAAGMLAAIITPLALAARHGGLALVPTALLFLPAVLLGARATVQRKSPLLFAPLALLYFVYGWARALSLVGVRVRRRQPARNAGAGELSDGSEVRMISDEIAKLFRSSSHYLGGLVVSLALGFISFPIYTRVFSVAEYGTIDFVQKILLLFTAISKLGLQNSALRSFDSQEFAADPAKARRYYSTLFLGMLATSAVMALTISGVVTFSSKSIVDRTLASLLAVASVIVSLRAVESVLWSFMRIEEKSKSYAISSVAIKAATIAGVCVVIPLAGASARSFFLGAISVELLAAGTMAGLLLRRGVVRLGSFDWRFFSASLSFGAPLVVYEVATIALDSGDRVLVRHYLGGDALGRYSVAYGLSSYVNDLLIAPLNLALIPLYMKLWSRDGREKTVDFLSRGLDLFLLVAAGAFALAVAGARDAVTLLASAKYAGADRLIPLLVAGLLIYTTHVFLSAGLLIHRKTLTMAKRLVLAAALNIGLNCYLLPRIGLMAAAIATLASYLFCVLLLGQASARVLPLRVDWGALARYGLGCTVACLTVSMVQFANPFIDLFARCGLSLLSYAGTLALLDGRVRGLTAEVIDRMHRREQVASVGLEAI